MHSRSGSRSRTVRSPTFASFDRKELWLERTRDLPSNDMQRSVIEGEIIAMSDEQVTAALTSIHAMHTKQEEDVQDPLSTGTATEPKPVTVESIDSNDGDSSDKDGDPTNRYSAPFPPPRTPLRMDTPFRMPRPPPLRADVPVDPYISQRRVRYEDPFQRTSLPRDSLPRDFIKESTTESMRARRAPIPTIESQTKPPTKFKGEEASFIKVDVFLKKMERYLRNGHGLDLSAEDISDYIFDSLDDLAHRW